MNFVRQTPMTRTSTRPRDDARERGQVLVIFAGGIVLFILLLAVVLDVSWYWANSLRVQRAADAAALAGAVYLPGQPGTAVTSARAEAQKNGYIHGTNATVIPTQDLSNPRQLDVSVSADVNTYFMRLIGITKITATRTSKAEYVMPVPMGSPENYYGVFGVLRGATFTRPQPTPIPGNTGLDAFTTVPSTVWTTPTNADATQNTSYAVSPTAATDTSQVWATFNNPNPPGTNQVPAAAIIDTIQVEFRGFINTASTSCKVNVDLSWGAGAAGTWSSVQQTPNLTTTKTTYPLLPATPPADTSAWGPHPWVPGDFTNANFRVRLSWGSLAGPNQVNTPANCPTTRTVSVDTLRVIVNYHTIGSTNVTTTTNDPLEGPGTACPNGVGDCFMPDGAALNPRGFWGTMNTEGASNVNGDAHQPSWDTAGNTNAPTCASGVDEFTSCYDPRVYYNYAIEMPPSSTGGYVYVFDPGFCYTDNNLGTGDRWFTDGSNTSRDPISSWYELLDMNNTPYNLNDDTVIASSNTKFMNMKSTDSTMVSGTNYGNDCKQTNTAYGDGRDYHDAWYLINPGNPLTGGPAGTVYRLHTTGTDPRAGGNPASQRTANGEQSFALYMTASTGAPRIYGYGAMQAFTPLCAGGPLNPAPDECQVHPTTTSSEFYLAQLKPEDAGKTMEILLWDPGDTSPLSANVQILTPTVSGWSPVSLIWTAKRGTSNGSANGSCNTSGSGSSIVTSTGASLGVFNGCWLKITIQIPDNYAAYQSGWWKIRYNMNGTGTSNDVTTWKVSIFGNPVHLVVP
jgi:hypothetical protein